MVYAKVTDIEASGERQTLTLSNGETISARLAVLANGLNVGLRRNLGIERQITSACHSISVGFDIATMSPTFRVAMGVPGSSSALAVARRFGMPTTVLERAARFLSNADKTFEEVVRRANDERAALELARTAAETRLREIEALKRGLEEELVRAREREHAIVSKEAESLLASVRRAREDLRAAQAKLRVKTPDEDSVREASRALDRVASTVAIGGELESLVARPEVLRGAVAPGDLKRGLRVYVSKLRAEAEVLDVMGSEVRVAAGAMKLTVSIHELRRTETEPAPRKMRRPDLKSTSLEVPIQTSDNTCDVRGMRVDDALSMVTSFLDRGVTLGRTVTFVIHGHGTGALRDALRNELCVQLRVTDLVDIGLERLLELIFQDCPQVVYTLAATPDDDAGLCRVQGHLDPVRRPLDLDARDRGVRQSLAVLDEGADMEIFDQGLGVALVQIPLALPVAVHADAEPDGMDLLSHALFSLFPLLIGAFARVGRAV